jgi:hypothetical protein
MAQYYNLNGFNRIFYIPVYTVFLFLYLSMFFFRNQLARTLRKTKQDEISQEQCNCPVHVSEMSKGFQYSRKVSFLFFIRYLAF